MKVTKTEILNGKFTTKKRLLLLIAFLALSCTKKEFIVSIEQPNKEQMNDLKVVLKLDNKEEKEFRLKQTNVAPSFETTRFLIADKGQHFLQVKLKDTIFSYVLHYPEEKYIIISPFLKKNGKMKIGVLKQKDPFIFH